MKDLHIKLNHGESIILKELCQYYGTTQTDIISSLLEIANNAVTNYKHVNWCKENNDEECNFIAWFQNYMLIAVENRK